MTEVALIIATLAVLLAALLYYATGDRFTGMPRRAASRRVHHRDA